MAQESTYTRAIEGFGLLLGTIIGAGLFVLPYTFYRAGLTWGLFFFVITFLISMAFHYLYAGLVAITPGKHRFPGYIKIYLGEFAGKVAFVFTFLSYYGAVLVYGILGGRFIESLSGVSYFWGATLFFVVGGLLFKMNIRNVGKADFYLRILLIIFIMGLSVLAFSNTPSMTTISLPTGADWFLPYGVLLFAFAGHSILPDLYEVVGRNSKGLFKKIIFFSLLASAAIYLLFVFAVLRVSGDMVSEDSLSGLYMAMGEGFVAVGSLIGLLTVLAPYVALGADLKLTFQYDYKFSDAVAWLFTFLPPFALFLFGFDDLLKILSLVGALGLGVFSLLTVLAAWKKRKELRDYLHVPVYALWLFLLGALVAAGALRELILFF